MMRASREFQRLCVHTMTTKPLSLQEAAAAYAKAGVRGITVWREHVEPLGAAQAARILSGTPLDVVSMCRGGFFCGKTARQRQAALDANRRALDEAQTIGAPLLVLVCGAVPGIPLAEARRQIADGIAALLPHAETTGVKLGIEPLHPMYADCRSAVNTLKQANDMAFALNHRLVGVVVDVYHLWWDPELESEIRRAGPKVFAFHISDWRTPTRDLLNDRALMGTGCINIREIQEWVEEAGFQGYHEVEIFSDEYWAMDQRVYLNKITAAYQALQQGEGKDHG